MTRFSPERLLAIRRLRLARRLWKRLPLLAYHLLIEKYPDCSYEQFLADLVPRRKRKPIRNKKNPLKRYGRYDKIQELLQQYDQTRNPQTILLADKLRRIITKPYQLKFSIAGKAIRFSLPADIPFNTIQDLVAECQAIADLDLIEQRINLFLTTTSYGK